MEKSKYEKANAEVVMFDNGDLLYVNTACGGPCSSGTGSSSPTWGPSCG